MITYRGEKFSGYNKPKRTPKGKKSHAVLAKEGTKGAPTAKNFRQAAKTARKR